jgi:hypothetical protein
VTAITREEYYSSNFASFAKWVKSKVLRFPNKFAKGVSAPIEGHVLGYPPPGRWHFGNALKCEKSLRRRRFCWLCRAEYDIAPACVATNTHRSGLSMPLATGSAVAAKRIGIVCVSRRCSPDAGAVPFAVGAEPWKWLYLPALATSIAARAISS